MKTTHKFKLIFCGASSVKSVDFLDIPQNQMNLISFDDILAEKFQTGFLVDNLILKLCLFFFEINWTLLFAFYNNAVYS